MERLYTKSEVSRLTGIDPRTIKYYVERKMITPTAKKSEGEKEFWLYSESDIVKIRQIALYRELGYSANEIKKIIQSQGFEWRKVLDTQIEALRKKKKHIENVIFAAELMRYSNETEKEWIGFDISDFDNNIDRFTEDTLAIDEDALTEQSIEKVSADIFDGLSLSEIEKRGWETIEIISKLRKTMENTPDSDEVQSELSNAFQYLLSLSGNAELNPDDILFAFRLISNISMDRITDLVFSKEGSTEFLLKALQVYCDHIKGGNLHG